MSTLRLLATLGGHPEAAISVSYPKRFTLPDLSEDLDRALKLLTSPVDIGTTLKASAVRQAANAALALSDEELTEAVKEIADRLAAEQELAAKSDLRTEGFNGAVFQAIVGAVESVAAGRIPRESGQVLLELGVPTTAERADQLLGSAGAGFVPTLEP
jgi:hypothetical protein